MYILTTTAETFDLDNPVDLWDAYFRLKNMERDAKELKKAIKEKMESLCGEEDELALPTGRIIKRSVRETFTYPISSLKTYLDEDQFNQCVKVVNKNVEEIAKNLSKDDRKDLSESKILNSTSVTYKMV